MVKKSGRRRLQTGTRLRPELRDRLQKEAKRHGVSLNLEIERRLEESFRRDALAGLPDKIVEALLEAGFKAGVAAGQRKPSKRAPTILDAEDER